MPQPNVDQIAAQVVQRARNGDQNAMALIAETRRSAQDPKGTKAREQLKAILRYCQRVPVSASEQPFIDGETPCEFSAETTALLGNIKDVALTKPTSAASDKARFEMLCHQLLDLAMVNEPKAGNVGAVIIADGSLLTDPRIMCVQKQLREDVHPVFRNAVKGVLKKVPDPNIKPVVFTGNVLCKARSIQKIRRNPFLAIRIWLPRVATELGCC